jgi:hypothetical protein
MIRHFSSLFGYFKENVSDRTQAIEVSLLDGWGWQETLGESPTASNLPQPQPHSEIRLFDSSGITTKPKG